MKEQKTFWNKPMKKNLIKKKELQVKPSYKKVEKSYVCPKNKRGFMDMMVNLMFFFMVVVLLIALLPAFKDMFNMAQQSDNLNCAGYCYGGNCDHQLSYNATLAAGGDTSKVGCLAIKLYIPYLVLGILVGGISKILYGRATQPQFG